MASRDTFEKAAAKVQRLMLFDEIQELKDRFKARHKIEFGIITSVILLAIKQIFFK